MSNSVPTIRLTTPRRKNLRIPLPACSRCAHASVSVLLRAERTVYVECARCHHIHAVPNEPGPGPARAASE
jgi:hypothetical protein